VRGSIRKQGKDSWRITVSLGKNPKTNRYEKYQETVRGKKADAERRLAELITQLEKGVNINPGKMTFGEFLDKWLDNYVRTKNLAPSTVYGYENIIQLHVKPELCHVPLNKLHPAHLRDFYAKLLREGRKDNKKSKERSLCPTYVLQMHRVISEALSHAVKWELAHRNVADAVDPPKKAARSIPVLSVEDVWKLLDAFRDDYLYMPVLIAITTGLRLGEALGLRWQDVDFKRKVIRVSQVQKLRKVKGGPNVLETGPPKTAKSTGPVDMPDLLVEELKRHRLRQKKDRLALGELYQDMGLVCCHANGEPINNATAESRFRKVARRAGYAISFHDLRHAHATLLLQAGVHPKVVSERLRHGQIFITMDTYSHVMPSLQQEAARKIDVLLTRRT